MPTHYRWSAGAGSGLRPPIVFIHGFTGNGQVFDTPVACLRACLGAASPPALAVHLPGHCPNDDAVPDTFLGVVDAVAAGLRDRGAQGGEVVGYSLGGRVALGLLVRHPDLFPRATLVGAHPGLEDAHERRARRRQDREWIALLRRDGMSAFVRRWEAQPIFATQRGASVEAVAAQRAIRRQHDPRRLALALEAMGLGVMPPMGRALPDLAIPVRLVVGEHDTKFRLLAEGMLPKLRRAELVVAAGCGHNPFVESPGPLVSRLFGDLEK